MGEGPIGSLIQRLRRKAHQDHVLSVMLLLEGKAWQSGKAGGRAEAQRNLAAELEDMIRTLREESATERDG